MSIRYGLEIERDYLVDIAFRLNTIFPIISTLFIYPANLYLLIVGIPSMKFEVRAVYVLNIIVHMAYDWTFCIIVRVYPLPPYGLFYCEGILSALGVSKHVIMAVLASATVLSITAFFVLMMRLHQLTVADATSRWRIPTFLQIIIYALLFAFCIGYVVGFVMFGTDVEEYEELVQNPDLEWLVQRGGTLLLFGEPGKDSRFINETSFLLISVLIFLPFLILYIAHALVYLRGRSKFLGATIFFILPLAFILVASVYDLSGILSGTVFAALRFGTTMLLVLDPVQFSLAFFIRSAANREILIRRLRKIRACDRLWQWMYGSTETKMSAISGYTTK